MTIRELRLHISTENYAHYTIANRLGTLLYKNCNWKDIKSADKGRNVDVAFPMKLASSGVSVVEWRILLK